MLLVHLYNSAGKKVPKYVHEATRGLYDSRIVPLLCDTFMAMSPASRERLLYGNARDKMARRLADWWEQHQEADRMRAIKDAARQRVAKVRAGALAKLTKEERQALGIIE